MFDVGNNLFGKYKIEQKLKPGNFGEVFVVYNYAVNRRSVVKFVEVQNPNTLYELVETYSQNLENRNVLKIHGAEIHTLTFNGITGTWVVMELEHAADGSLQSMIERGSTSVKFACDTIHDVLLGLEYIHANNIIHGDLKPNNILISNGVPKIADFGLAMNDNLPGSLRAAQCFYVSHASPELLSGGNVNVASDIYACGITLMRAVSGIHDWHTIVAADPKYRDNLLQGKAFDKHFPKHIPTSVKRIIKKACNPVLGRRYVSAGDFRNALAGLTFERDWREQSPMRWISQNGNDNYEIAVEGSGPYKFTARKNGRRQNKLCVTFENKVDAIAHLNKTVSRQA